MKILISLKVTQTERMWEPFLADINESRCKNKNNEGTADETCQRSLEMPMLTYSRNAKEV